jgi:hypothetical protein
MEMGARARTPLPTVMSAEGQDGRMSKQYRTQQQEGREAMDLSEETPLVWQVVPPRTARRDLPALETAMAALALDERHPIALEIAGSATMRMFLVRATSGPAQNHLADQLYARYPQASLLPLSREQDPLQLRDGEALSVLELSAGAASYLPLRSWRERELLQEGTDPVLGLLAALGKLPPDLRVIAQLALVPAPHAWSRASQRLAVEHPLEQERMRERYRASAGFDGASGAGSSLGLLVMAVLGFLVLRLAPLLHRIVPTWMEHAALAVWHGKAPALTFAQESLLALACISILLAFVLLFILYDQLRRHLGLGRARIYDMRLVQQKTSRIAYRARLRLYVIGPGTKGDPLTQLSQARTWRDVAAAAQHLWQVWAYQRAQAAQRQATLSRLVAAYRQYHLSAGGYFRPRVLPRGAAQRLVRMPTQWWHLRTGWQRGIARSPHYLGVEDVAHLWHLVQGVDLPEVPLLERGRARTLPVPAVLPAGNGWHIGASLHAGHRMPVFLPWPCLRGNFFAVASTGKGKSTLFLHLAEAALAVGSETIDGLLVVEPHRDLIELLLERIPRTRQDDVVLVDLADLAHPVGINVLDATLGRDRDKTIANLIAIFAHLWSNSWGPRTENVLETCLKTLAEANANMVKADPQGGPDRQYTLLDIVSLLRNWSFRHSVLEQVQDGTLTGWWQLYYEPMDLRHQTEVIGSVVNKMSKYASSYTARRILGQPRSSIDLGAVVRQGNILLVSAASGVVGADIAALVGATILGLFQTALAEQVRLPIRARRHFLVLVDEFQFFGGANCQAGLAELRKMGGHFGLATQSLEYLDKLDRTLRSTVLANADHLFAFAMSGIDARLLEHEFEAVEVGDITSLDDFQCYARLSVGGRRLPVFSLSLAPPGTGNPGSAAYIRQQSRTRDARPVEAVDTLIHHLLTRHELQARKKIGTAPSTQGSAEREEQGTGGTHATAREKRFHAPRTKKGDAGSDGGDRAATSAGREPDSLHMIYDSPPPEEDADGTSAGDDGAGG